MRFWNRDEYDVEFAKAMQQYMKRASMQYVKARDPGLYWLVELYTQHQPTMYCQIPPRKGFPCGFTMDPNQAFVWQSQWAARFVAWRLSRGGKFNCHAASHIWMR